ncbi:hypothetical protein EVG20_g7919 [Dentipellis fragilis]|uniref:Fungal-type protein kinase domain-containing protein n=1 Tax=Dentipellis fragilis TaxID=205917 RepID=A0A4Y9YB08_9AGAM|nr:hypothetical protein EVG20_g7919 [Dentipellis fragilis]
MAFYPAQLEAPAVPMLTQRPRVLEDMEVELNYHAKEIPLDAFVRAFLGVASDMWAAPLQQLLEDSFVERELRDYCFLAHTSNAPEVAATLLNDIKKHAARLLRVTYPLEDIHFISQDPPAVREQLLKSGTIARTADVDAIRNLDRGGTYGSEDVLLPIQIEMTDARVYEDLSTGAVDDGLFSPLYEKFMMVSRSTVLFLSVCSRSCFTQYMYTRNTGPAGFGDPLSSMSDAERKKIVVYETTYTVAPPAFKDTSPMAQLIAKQARDVLAYSRGSRQHAFGMVLRGEHMQLWYFNPIGIVHTPQEFSILDNFGTFASIIVAFCSLTERQWGNLEIIQTYITASKSPASIPRFPHPSLTGALIKFDDGRVYCVEDRIHSEPAMIVGRRTFVYNTVLWNRQETADDHVPERLVIKLSYVPCWSETEWSFIQDANRAGIEHMPEGFSWGEFFRVSERGQGCVPLLQKDAVWSDRAFRVAVFPEYEPILGGITPKDYIRVIRELATSAYGLYRLYKIGILHRDVSENNIMVDPRHADQPWVVLNDFDLAIRTEPDGIAPLTTFAGTRHLLSYEASLQMPMRHRLRHDLEALFTLALWWAADVPYTFTEEESTTPLAWWVLAKGEHEVRAFKEALYAGAHRVADTVPLAADYKPFAPHLDLLVALFREANRTLLPPSTAAVRNAPFEALLVQVQRLAAGIRRIDGPYLSDSDTRILCQQCLKNPRRGIADAAQSHRGGECGQIKLMETVDDDVLTFTFLATLLARDTT